MSTSGVSCSAPFCSTCVATRSSANPTAARSARTRSPSTSTITTTSAFTVLLSQGFLQGQGQRRTRCERQDDLQDGEGSGRERLPRFPVLRFLARGCGGRLDHHVTG